MKKILLLFILIFSVSLSQAQTLQNPTLGNTTTNTLKIKTPATVTSVNFLTAIDADGLLSKVLPKSNIITNDSFVSGTTVTDALNSLNTSKIGGIGTLNYLPFFSSSKTLGDSFLYQDSEGIRIGNAKPSFGVGFSVSKNISVINRHVFEDYSVINTVSSGQGWGTFDASTEMTGSVVNEHFNGYQSRLNYSSSANMPLGFGYGMTGILIRNGITGSGTLERAHGILIDDVYGNPGQITQNYGIKILPQTRGILNYDLYSLGYNNFLSALSLGNDTVYNGTDKLVNSGSSLFGGIIKSTSDISLRNSGSYYSFGSGNETDANSKFMSFFHDGTNTVFVAAGKGTFSGATGNFEFDKFDGTTLSNLSRIKSNGVFQVANLAGITSALLETDTEGNIQRSATVLPTSGTYSPTLANTTNVSGSTLSNAYYTRIGDIVTVYIAVNTTVTLTSIRSTITFTLPINRTGGTYVNTSVGSGGAAGNLFTNSVPSFYRLLNNNNEVAIDFVPVTTGAYTLMGSFAYKITTP